MMEKCTFAPQVNESSADKRSLEMFINDQYNQIKRVNDKVTLVNILILIFLDERRTRKETESDY